MQTSQATASDRLKVFVSYAREDGSPFAAQLVDLLHDTGFDAWIDQEDLGAGEEWKRRLRQRIASCDTVLFVLTPAAATSRFCQWEADVATGMGKRILVVAPGPTDHLAPPGRIANLQWISFHADPMRKGSGFYAGQKTLVAVLRQDMDWHRQQTEIFLQAERWQQLDRSEDALMRGIPLKKALAWRADIPSGKATPGLIDLFLEASVEGGEASRAAAARRADEERVVQEHIARLEQRKREAAERERQAQQAQREQAMREQAHREQAHREQAERDRQEEDQRRFQQQREAERYRPSQRQDLFGQPGATQRDTFREPDPFAAQFREPPRQDQNDIFSDPAFSRPRPQTTALARTPRKHADDDHDDEHHGGGSLAIIAAVLVLLVGGAGAVAMFLPTMPNPFSSLFAGDPPAEEAATDAAEDGADASGDPAGDLEIVPEPTGKPGAKKDADTTAWLGAKDKGTLLAYRTYMLREPKGRYYNNALQESRRRIGALSVKPSNTSIKLPGPVAFRDLPTKDNAGRTQGTAGQSFPIIDRINTPNEGEWYVLDRGGPWPFRFISVADVNK